MIANKKIIYLLFLIFPIVSCTNPQFFWKGEGSISIEIYKAGKLVKQHKLSSEFNLYMQLKQFVNHGKWKNDYNTYAPNIILRNEEFEINLLFDKVIVNYVDKKRSIQSLWRPKGKDLEVLKTLRGELESNLE